MPQKSVSYIKWPNYWRTAETIANLGQNERMLLSALIRLTYGYHKTTITKTLQELADYLQRDKSNIHKALQNLQAASVIGLVTTPRIAGATITINDPAKWSDSALDKNRLAQLEPDFNKEDLKLEWERSVCGNINKTPIVDCRTVGSISAQTNTTLVAPSTTGMVDPAIIELPDPSPPNDSSDGSYRLKDNQILPNKNTEYLLTDQRAVGHDSVLETKKIFNNPKPQQTQQSIIANSIKTQWPLSLTLMEQYEKELGHLNFYGTKHSVTHKFGITWLGKNLTTLVEIYGFNAVSEHFEELLLSKKEKFLSMRRDTDGSPLLDPNAKYLEGILRNESPNAIRKVPFNFVYGGPEVGVNFQMPREKMMGLKLLPLEEGTPGRISNSKTIARAFNERLYCRMSPRENEVFYSKLNPSGLPVQRSFVTYLCARFNFGLPESEEVLKAFESKDMEIIGPPLLSYIKTIYPGKQCHEDNGYLEKI